MDKTIKASSTTAPSSYSSLSSAYPSSISSVSPPRLSSASKYLDDPSVVVHSRMIIIHDYLLLPPYLPTPLSLHCRSQVIALEEKRALLLSPIDPSHRAYLCNNGNPLDDGECSCPAAGIPLLTTFSTASTSRVSPTSTAFIGSTETPGPRTARGLDKEARSSHHRLLVLVFTELDFNFASWTSILSAISGTLSGHDHR